MLIITYDDTMVFSILILIDNYNLLLFYLLGVGGWALIYNIHICNVHTVGTQGHKWPDQALAGIKD